MRTIETNTRITIRKALEQNPLLAKGLTYNGDTLEADIASFANVTGLHPEFIRMNLQQIRNWI